MIRRKMFAAPVMLVMLMLLAAGAASGDSILTSTNQIGQVVSPAGNSGSFPISSMLAVDRNGALQPISGPMPPNTVIIVTWISGNFIAANPSLNASTTFNLGDYYRMSPQITNGFASFAEGISPGIPITNLGATVYLHLASDTAKTPITGVLNLRVMGYVANIN
jgi:hypothetical protein